MTFELCVNEKISLKVRSVEDAEAFFLLTDKNREHLRPWLPWVDTTVSTEDTKKYIEEQIKEFTDKTAADFGVWYEGAWVGSAGFHTIKRNNDWAEIGYWLDEGHTGKGIMTETVKAIINYGFNELGLHRIQIKCDSDNIKSKAVPERLKFTLEGTTREDHKKNGIYSNGLIYGLLRSEWNG